MPWIDLSHPIYAGMPQIPLLPPVDFRPLMRFESGHPANVSALSLATHSGTHVDAPFHFIADGKTIDQYPPEHFTGPGVVVPVTRAAGEAIPVDDLAVADVRQHDIVLLHTGWDAVFSTPDYFVHPYLSDEAARWLVERQVKMVGVDCVNVEMPIPLRPAGFTFPVHRTLLGHDALIIENLTNLAPIVGRRVTVYAFALKIRGSDGAQARVVATYD